MIKQLLAYLCLFVFFIACKKDVYKQYEGNFYLQVPVFEDNNTWLVSSSDHFSINISPNKYLWNFKRYSGNEFIIEANGDSAVVTEQCIYKSLSLMPLKSSPYPGQVFTLIPSANDLSTVSFRSVCDSEYITLYYCYRINECFEYTPTMEYRDSCHAYNLPLTNQADTCYCVQQFKMR